MKYLVFVVSLLVVVLVFFWPHLLARIPDKCPACKRRKLAVLHKKPSGQVVTSSYDNSHGGSGANTIYQVRFKCRHCGEKSSRQVSA